MITSRLLDVMQVEAEQRAQDMFRQFMFSYSGARLRMIQGQRNAPMPMQPMPGSPQDDSAEDEMGIEE